MSDSVRLRTRFYFFALLLLAPMLRLLILGRYGFLYPEVGILLAVHFAAAAFFALITRNGRVFQAVTLVLILLLSAASLSVMLYPMRVRFVVPVFAAVCVSAMYFLRDNFYKLTAVFVIAALGGDIVKAASDRFSFEGRTAEATGEKYNHTLHIIFDEMQGLGSLPADCASCQIAKASLERTLTEGHFQMFPYAFSNYRATRDSVPSILNDRLLERYRQYFPSPRDAALNGNAYFDRYIKQGYDIRVYQSDHILYSAPKYSSVVATTYRVNSLGRLHSAGLAWSTRLNQILSVYLSSDWIWWGAWTKLTPDSVHPRVLLTVPLGAEEVWPDQVLKDVGSARKNTLFFVHLLTTHRPFMIRPDGSLRPTDEWRGYLVFNDDETEQYRRTYEAYGEQLQFAARRLNAFLDGLRRTGQYDTMTIVLHGDHGSRIRILKPNQRTIREQLNRTDPDTEFYDYVSDPDARDLASRFSTMLALKRPGAKSAQTEEEAGSVLYFLRKFLWSEPEASAHLNSVYLFTQDGHQREIPILRYWPKPKQYIQEEGN